MALQTFVTEHDFLSTYPDGVRANSDYERCKTLIKTRMTQDGVGRTLGRSPGTISRWLNGVTPTAVQALENAQELGVVPLTEDSEKLFPIAQLYSWCLWSGHVDAHYRAGLHNIPEKIEELRKLFKRNLDLEGLVLNKVSGGAQLYFGEFGALYGRVLSAAGYPAGKRKCQNLLHIPPLISANPNARKYFVQVLFLEKYSAHSRSLNLNDSITKKASRKFSGEIISLLQAEFPEVGFSDDSVRFGKRKRAQACILMSQYKAQIKRVDPGILEKRPISELWEKTPLQS